MIKQDGTMFRVFDASGRDTGKYGMSMAKALQIEAKLGIKSGGAAPSAKPALAAPPKRTSSAASIAPPRDWFWHLSAQDRKRYDATPSYWSDNPKHNGWFDAGFESAMDSIAEDDHSAPVLTSLNEDQQRLFMAGWTEKHAALAGDRSSSKINAVEALLAGATTPGERAAAEAALARLRAKKNPRMNLANTGKFSRTRR